MRYAQFVYLDKFLDHQFRDGSLTVTVALKGIFLLRRVVLDEGMEDPFEGRFDTERTLPI